MVGGVRFLQRSIHVFKKKKRRKKEKEKKKCPPWLLGIQRYVFLYYFYYIVVIWTYPSWLGPWEKRSVPRDLREYKGMSSYTIITTWLSFGPVPRDSAYKKKWSPRLEEMQRYVFLHYYHILSSSHGKGSFELRSDLILLWKVRRQSHGSSTFKNHFIYLTL